MNKRLLPRLGLILVIWGAAIAFILYVAPRLPDNVPSWIYWAGTLLLATIGTVADVIGLFGGEERSKPSATGSTWDQQSQTVHGHQTNVQGDVDGPVVTGDNAQIGDRSETHVSTEGGTYIEGNVEASGDFIGRDQINLIVQQERRLFAGVPPRPSHFVGRGEMVEQLVGQLCAGTTTALSAEGLPGVGKTTLAVMLAHHRRVLEHFEDGILWASLGRNPEVAGILASWADALGVEVTDLPEPRQRARAVADAIGQRHLLLVIDDAWQAEPALLLRCGGPNCTHLLTTRDQDIARRFADAAHVVNVPVLEDDPAFLLLQTLAPEACAVDPEGARALARQVGNLPLALELVGGYLAAPERSYFPELSAEALEELADPRRRLALAQQRLGDSQAVEVSLEQTIALSLEDLPQVVRSVFYALGAFAPKPERFQRSAAEAVAATDARSLALLIARNLVEQEGDSLALHQTIADAARTQTSLAAIQRHRDHYLALVDEDRENWRRIEGIYGQISHAWQQQITLEPHDEALLHFVWALHLYQDRRGLRREQLAWYEAALDYARATGHAATAALLNNMGEVYRTTGQPQQALELYQQALPIRREVGDRVGESVTRYNLARVHEDLGNLAAAEEQLVRVVALDEALNHPDLERHRAELARIQALRRDASSSG